MTSAVDEWEDSFNNQLADGTSNKGDLPAEYVFNSGRHRASETPSGGSKSLIVDRTDLNSASGLCVDCRSEAEITSSRPERAPLFEGVTLFR